MNHRLITLVASSILLEGNTFVPYIESMEAGERDEVRRDERDE